MTPLPQGGVSIASGSGANIAMSASLFVEKLLDSGYASSNSKHKIETSSVEWAFHNKRTRHVLEWLSEHMHTASFLTADEANAYVHSNFPLHLFL